jgi:arylsulfatase A-like enzyme
VRTTTFIICVILIASHTALHAADEHPTKPNVIIILADDMGWGDVGFNGCVEIPTPNLDALAKSGVICTNGYASHPYCSPSRAGLLTGRHQQRFGHEGNPINKEEGLPLSETLLPALLKQNGYRTAAIGKWHLGNEEHYWPTNRGFDEWFGFTGGSMTYWGQDRPDGSGIMRNGRPVPKSEINYLTDDFSQESVAFIDRNKDKPFFLYLAYNAPHSPNHATKAHLHKTEHIEQAGRSIYAAMVAGMDEGIGRIVQLLDELKLREHTLIIFYSDNGGRGDLGRSLPFRGHKGQLYEGGIHVPFCVSWPERIPAGQSIAAPITGLDVFPTVLASADVPVPDDLQLDGINLLPYLTDSKHELPERTLVWRYSLGQDGYGYAVRDRAYKLVRVNANHTSLFNIADDPYEQHDVKADNPDVIQLLTTAYEQWAKEMKTPLWVDPHGANIRNEQIGRQKVIDQASQGERQK